MRTAVLHRLAATASTQDEVHRLGAEGAPHGTAVVAEEQTAGRGSRGNAWTSPRGGLWLSVLLRPRVPGAVEPLSLRTGLAVAGTLERLGAGGVRLKWPNDLLLGDRKVGGILCESRWQGEQLAWVAVGLGLNVRNAPPAGVRTEAAALAEVAPGLDAAGLAQPVADAIAALADRPAALTEDELAAFAVRDALAGRRLAGPVQGIAEGPTPDGRLRVRLPDGTTTLVRSGPVVLAG